MIAFSLATFPSCPEKIRVRKWNQIVLSLDLGLLLIMNICILDIFLSRHWHFFHFDFVCFTSQRTNEAVGPYSGSRPFDGVPILTDMFPYLFNITLMVLVLAQRVFAAWGALVILSGCALLFSHLAELIALRW
jgi:hypothetical protein